MALIYDALNLSRFILEFSERILKPKILKIFSSSSIVTKEAFQKVEEERDYYHKKYKNERDEKLKIQRELDTVKEPKDLIIDGGVIDEDDESDFKSLVGSILNDSNNKKSFKRLIGMINRMDSIKSIENMVGEYIGEYLSLNLIEKFVKSSSYNYRFTQFGEKVRDTFLKEYYN